MSRRSLSRDPAILGTTFALRLVYSGLLVQIHFAHACTAISVLYQIFVPRDGYWRFRMFDRRDFSVYGSANGVQPCA